MYVCALYDYCANVRDGTVMSSESCSYNYLLINVCDAARCIIMFRPTVYCSCYDVQSIFVVLSLSCVIK